MKLIHPAEDLQYELHVVLDLLVLHSHLVDFKPVFLSTDVEAFELKLLLHFCCSPLDLVPRLFDAKVSDFFVDWVTLVVQQVFDWLLSHSSQQAGGYHNFVVVYAEEVVEERLVGVTSQQRSHWIQLALKDYQTAILFVFSYRIILLHLPLVLFQNGLNNASITLAFSPFPTM